MPIVPAANSYTFGIHKQTNEATVGTVADYSLPVFGSPGVMPVEDLKRIQVTDANSIQGDPYKGPQSWSAQVEFPAYGSALGRFLQAMWPTDSISGAGPYTHTYTGLGGTQPWISLYTNWVNAGAFQQTFGKGLASSIGFTSTADGGPMNVQFGAIGQEVTVASFTVTNAETLALGYFQLQATGAKIELDVDTPDVNPSTQPEKIRSVTVTVDREVSPEPIADAFVVSNLSQGLVVPSLQMEFLYTSWDAYRGSYFGTVAGTAASPTVLYGAVEITWKHSVQAGWSFVLYIPKVALRALQPQPDPGGAGIALAVEGAIAKPASGEHVQPILINGTTPAY
jgi:hypothetical protein